MSKKKRFKKVREMNWDLLDTKIAVGIVIIAFLIHYIMVICGVKLITTLYPIGIGAITIIVRLGLELLSTVYYEEV